MFRQFDVKMLSRDIGPQNSMTSCSKRVTNTQGSKLQKKINQDI